MAQRCTRNFITLVENKPYLTQLDVADLAAECTLMPPGPIDVSIEDEGTVKALTRHSGTARLKIEVDDDGHVEVDNLTCKVWTGKHLYTMADYGPNSVTPPVLSSGRISFANASMFVDLASAHVATLQSYTSWALLVCAKRKVASFAGYAHVAFFGSYASANHQLMALHLDQNGVVRCTAVINGAAETGRATDAGEWADEEECVWAIHSSPTLGTKIYKNRERVDTTNVGTGAGVSFAQFTSWGSTPMFTLGSKTQASAVVESTGGVDVSRVLLLGNPTVHEVLRASFKLEQQYL